MTIQVTQDALQPKSSWKPKVFDWLMGRAEAPSEDPTSQVSVEISLQAASGVFNGTDLNTSAYKPVKWTVSDTPCLYSYIAYVINRKSGAITVTYAHAGPSARKFYENGAKDPSSAEVPSALQGFNQNYLLVFLWASVIGEYGPSNLLAPSDAFKAFLEDCGAGPNWNSWINTRDYEIHGPGPYALVGVMGSKKGGGYEKKVDVTVKQAQEIPTNPSVDLKVALKYTADGWTPTGVLPGSFRS